MKVCVSPEASAGLLFSGGLILIEIGIEYDFRFAGFDSDFDFDLEIRVEAQAVYCCNLSGFNSPLLGGVHPDFCLLPPAFWLLTSGFCLLAPLRFRFGLCLDRLSHPLPKRPFDLWQYHLILS